jgi:hypothetical protein
MRRKIEYAKAQVRAKVEPPFRVIQASIRLYESALSWFVGKHRAAGNVIRLVELVDGTKAVDGYG